MSTVAATVPAPYAPSQPPETIPTYIQYQCPIVSRRRCWFNERIAGTTTICSLNSRSWSHRTKTTLDSKEDACPL
jgi:hypothetical protein